jgi:N-acetylglutamate synthase-like GNAT family acetyltransferase
MQAPSHPLVRVAQLTDAAALAHLSTQLGYPSSEEQVCARLRLLDDPERTLLVVEDEGVVAGFIDVHVQRTVEEKPYGEVGGLAIATGHRASGLGRTLLAAAAAWSREHGLAHLWIRANLARGAAAHGFYQHVGCRTVKDQRVYEFPL